MHLSKEVFCLPLLFALGYRKPMRNKCGPIQYSLGCPPNSIPCLCLFLLCLCLFCLTFLIHTLSTLECTNPSRLDPNNTLSLKPHPINPPQPYTLEILTLSHTPCTTQCIRLSYSSNNTLSGRGRKIRFFFYSSLGPETSVCALTLGHHLPHSSDGRASASCRLT